MVAFKRALGVRGVPLSPWVFLWVNPERAFLGLRQPCFPYAWAGEDSKRLAPN